MKTAQYQWSRSDGWTPNLPNLEVERQGIVFVFGARSLIETGELVSELRGHFKGAAILGCSTSGEIIGDTVVDNSVIATAVDFEHTRLRTASAPIAEAKSSYEVGQELARQLNDPSLRHVFVLSDGLKVNGSDLARGLASGVSEGVSITGGLSGDGTDFAEEVSVSTPPRRAPSGSPPSVCTAIICGLATDRWAVGSPFGRSAPSLALRATSSMSSTGTRPSISTRRISGTMPRSCRHQVSCFRSSSPRHMTVRVSSAPSCR